MNETFKNHVYQALNKGLRLDGRKKEDFREITIETGVISTAEGSARVKCGDTEVIAGIKLSLGTPYSDTPNDGVLSTNTELLPLSNPDFEGGPPRIDAIEVARVIDRAIREGKAIDTKKLCVEKGEKVWMVNMDVLPINMDGNLIDVGALACIAALKNTKFPEVVDGKVDYKHLSKKSLPVNALPIEITVVKIKDNFIVDPTQTEEKILDSRLTVGVLEDETICALQKGGDQPLTQKDVDFMVDLAIKKSKELRKLL
ncbi:MAG: exosome complex protein Rrp42 [Nanoarchaeota archaeon]|nr:exosome complex protein Rrp42 [Nanoarchaeota archaeon]MBU1029764.1 exosome complex protein Rrp42 [Nanoarchaeota archaeon]MBU1850771.1 exosome complex protein Rrp42 [Nanoarchaeota archaeon]